jgi:hypothetical protein
MGATPPVTDGTHMLSCTYGVGLFVDEYFGARRSKWRSVEVRRATHVGPGRELRIDAGSPKAVQGKEAVGKQIVPKIEGKVAVGGAQSSNEVIFKSVN